MEFINLLMNYLLLVMFCLYKTRDNKLLTEWSNSIFYCFLLCVTIPNPRVSDFSGVKCHLVVTTGYFEQILFFILTSSFLIFSPWYSIFYSTLRFWGKKMKSSRYSTVPTSWASSGRDSTLPDYLGALFLPLQLASGTSGRFPLPRVG